MKKMFTISEVGQLLDLPTATLRFWEEKGLFSVAKSDNRYRQYTLQDIIHIADILSYRRLSIPIRDVTALKDCSMEGCGRQLKAVREEFEKKILFYQQAVERVQDQQERLKEVQRLHENTFAFEEVPFSEIVPFGYSEKEKLLQYIKRPSLYVRYFDTCDLSTETRGIIADPARTHTLPLWQKKEGVLFLTFLIKETVEQDYHSDLSEKLPLIQKKYHTGVLLAQYLLTAVEDGFHIDYLKAYLEVTPMDGAAAPSADLPLRR